MSKKLKKLLSFTLLICMVTVSLSSAKVYGSEIMPRYNNVISVKTFSDITSNGSLTIDYKYTGIQNVTTKAIITTCIEKKTLFFFWTKIEIGDDSTELVQTINNYTHTGSLIIPLSERGTYRVNITYEIHGTGGSPDTITYQKELTY